MTADGKPMPSCCSCGLRYDDVGGTAMHKCPTSLYEFAMRGGKMYGPPDPPPSSRAIKLEPLVEAEHRLQLRAVRLKAALQSIKNLVRDKGDVGDDAVVLKVIDNIATNTLEEDR